MTDMIKQDRGNTRSGTVGSHEPHLTGDDWGYEWAAWRIYDVLCNEVRIYLLIFEDGEHVPDTVYREYRHSTKTHDLHWVDGGKREDVVRYLKNERLTCQENYKHVTPLTQVQDRIRKNLDQKMLHLHEKARHKRWAEEKRRKLVAIYGHGRGGSLFRAGRYDMI